MESHKTQPEKPSSTTTTPPVSSCRKKKNEEATFLEDIKDHIDEFIHASMDEHKTCFKKTIKRCLECRRLLLKGALKLRELRVLCPYKRQWETRMSPTVTSYT